jgi:hypothetical protein
MADLMAALAIANESLSFLRTAKEVSTSVASLGKVAAVQEALIAVQNEVLAIQQTALKLQEENRELRERQVRLDVKTRYGLVRTDGGATLYVSKVEGVPEHYVCPRCLENGTPHVLQGPGENGRAQCVECRNMYQVHPSPSDPPPQRRPSIYG